LEVEIVMKGCRKSNRGPATVTGHADKMAHQFLEEMPREDVGNGKGFQAAPGSNLRLRIDQAVKTRPRWS